MSNKLTLATAALITAALFGMNADSAKAQGLGGFVSFGNDDFSISLGTRNGPGYYWETVSHRVWRPGFYRYEHVPALYRTEYRPCGQSYQVLVRGAFERRIWVAGHYDIVQKRVRVNRRFHRRGHRRDHVRNRHRRNDDFNRQGRRSGRTVSKRSNRRR